MSVLQVDVITLDEGIATGGSRYRQGAYGEVGSGDSDL